MMTELLRGYFFRICCILLIGISTPSVLLADCVVLMHGLARTSGAMKSMQKAFDAKGYQVINVSYPSRKQTVEQLAPLVDELGYKQCRRGSVVHFATHSMGGILVRYHLTHNEVPQLGRVVMLAPPNQGSQVVDFLRDVPGYKLMNGPAGLQLGTDADSIPAQLGPVDFELGVIAGTRSVNMILSQFLPNPDDGKVSVANTRVEGMGDFLVLPVTHTFMMHSDVVIRQAIHFIEHGEFKR